MMTRYGARSATSSPHSSHLGVGAAMPGRAALWPDGLWTQRKPLDDLTALPKELRGRLADALPLRARAGDDARERRRDDGQVALADGDGAQVETVLMRSADRATVCVSSQAGCAMGCTFCATGQAGFERHLDCGEIVEQVVRAQHVTTARVSHVVFMGMGEPLANVDPVLAALERLHDDFGLSARHLTVSTVGVVPGMRRLAQHRLPVTLAVSLHAPDDDLRATLVPLNRRYPINSVLDAARVRRDQGPAGHLRVRVHRRRQRPPRAGRSARPPPDRPARRRTSTSSPSTRRSVRRPGSRPGAHQPLRGSPRGRRRA